MTFKKTLVAASLAALSMAALSEEAATPAADEIAVTANVNIASSYRFRGIDQTFNQPALQGGFDVTLPMGFYVGNWNSNVNGNAAGFAGGNLEMDLYGGWKTAFDEDWGLDTGLYNYFYPGSNPSNGMVGLTNPNPTGYSQKPGMVYNLEYYIGGNWKTVSLKQYFALTDYFNVQGFNGSSTAGSGYTDLKATYDLSDVHPALAGFGLLGHAGYFYMRNFSQANYADWELGVTKDFGKGWNAKVSYIQAATQGDCSKGQFYCFSKSGFTAGGSTENAGHATAMVTVGRTF
ncbi:MAG: TorF family putative porin [Fluviibacter sp.]|jgi:uncharacterized protein (TIGR02001 family)